MQARERSPAQPPACPMRLALAREAALQQKLPLTFALGGKPRRCIGSDGQLLAHATGCSHRLTLPDHAPVPDGYGPCPRHAYSVALIRMILLEHPKLTLAAARTSPLANGRVIVSAVHNSP